MKFVYKINSRFDGFTPRRIPDRLLPGKNLKLGWSRYIEAVEPGSEVWIYFRGAHSFEPGIYVKGFVRSIDSVRYSVMLRVREYATDAPLTDRATSKQVAEVVAPRYRQVFLLPEEFEAAPKCTLSSVADSCLVRRCELCPTWRHLPIVQPADFKRPTRLRDAELGLREVVPAYWVIPPRSFLVQARRSIARPIKATSEVFYRFKVGEVALAYPLARAIYEALRLRDLLDYDCIVPIPLSPDKIDAKEIHRTLLLAQELERLLDAPVVQGVTLSRPITKSRMRSAGASRGKFEAAYADALRTHASLAERGSILLVDDVCTHGSTIRCALMAIKEASPGALVVAAAAGQMIMRESVQNETRLVG